MSPTEHEAFALMLAGSVALALLIAAGMAARRAWRLLAGRGRRKG